LNQNTWTVSITDTDSIAAMMPAVPGIDAASARVVASEVLATSANIPSLMELRIWIHSSVNNVVVLEATIRSHCTLKPMNCQFASRCLTEKPKRMSSSIAVL
jgi:hypothetical protein